MRPRRGHMFIDKSRRDEMLIGIIYF
jgi:hypothetical protein